MKTFISKDGQLRIYAKSATGTSILACKILFVNSDFTAPIGRNRPEENLVLDRMKFDSNTHFVQGSDSAIAEPLPCSFSIRAFDRRLGWEAVNWILNGSSLACTSFTMGSTKGTSQLKDYAGTNYTTNTFTDTSKKCFNVQLRYTPDTGGRPASIILKEVFFNPGEQTINEAEDSLTLNLSGMVYGSIDYGSADWLSNNLVTST